MLLSLNVPYALYRNHLKGVADQADPTGKAHRDAAFADYSVNLGFAYRFGGKKAHSIMKGVPTINDVKN